MTTLVVEVTDLAAASHTLFDVGSTLSRQVGAAMDDAASCTGMAGDDPGGIAWAAAYEPAAGRAAKAAQDVTNGALQLSTLVGATAENYARAESASTLGDRHAVDDAITDLPPIMTIGFTTSFPGAGGAAPNAPYGWSIVEHVVRAVWPDGHQDRLHQAAAAWNRSADALGRASLSLTLLPIESLVDGLPEGSDIRTACWSLGHRIDEVASAHRSIASACEELAHHLDVVRSKVESEIHNFIAWTAGIEFGGAVLAGITGGLSEAGAQAVEGARIRATALNIAAHIEEFGAAVTSLVRGIPAVAELSSRISAGLKDLLSIRIVAAEVAGVPGLRVLSIARDGRSAAGATNAAEAGGELGAVTRLTDDANLPAELRSALGSGRAGEWNDLRTLHGHFVDHASDFGITSESEYARQAGEFFHRGVTDQLPTKIDKRGNILIYDPASNTFGCYSSEGAVRSFYKPSGGEGYWNRQGVRVLR